MMADTEVKPEGLGLFTHLPRLYNIAFRAELLGCIMGLVAQKYRRIAIDNSGVVAHANHRLNQTAIGALPNKPWGLIKDGT